MSLLHRHQNCGGCTGVGFAGLAVGLLARTGRLSWLIIIRVIFIYGKTGGVFTAAAKPPKLRGFTTEMAYP
jgi:hypothetical protein